MDNIDMLELCERHNKVALETSMAIIMDAKKDMAQAMVILESVMAGIVGHYIKTPKASKIVLDELSKNALERITDVWEEDKQ